MKLPSHIHGPLLILVGVCFFVAAGVMLNQGRAVTPNHHVSTRKGDPVDYWFQVGCGIAGGTFGVIAGIYVLKKGDSRK